ncbi:L,D-transpeptidase family protein [Bacillus toyonensis]|uniref:L,D-transpeptidase family protein n=1 Tax=Bacillus toyonensis TaxID=155322 RepID=UPI0026EFD399|nr:L,D-transpeptidase family protein [Bacillus toyonensis]
MTYVYQSGRRPSTTHDMHDHGVLPSGGVGITLGDTAGNQFIIINKAINQLAFYERGKLNKVFKVATGKYQSLTPEGKFKIVNKIKNRPYYKGGIPGGDPRNPLGTRWLGLNARGTWGTTYAIHGNNNPSSIGKHVSHGCIRMFNNEVEELYDRITLNTPVVITTSKKNFDSIAVENGLKITETNRGYPPIRSMVNGMLSCSCDPAPSKSLEILKIGSRGNAVLTLQLELTSLGYNTKGIDGIFGYNTAQAVRRFQKNHYLVVDGIVGSATKKVLRGYFPRLTDRSTVNGLLSCSCNCKSCLGDHI